MAIVSFSPSEAYNEKIIGMKVLSATSEGNVVDFGEFIGKEVHHAEIGYVEEPTTTQVISGDEIIEVDATQRVMKIVLYFDNEDGSFSQFKVDPLADITVETPELSG